MNFVKDKNQSFFFYVLPISYLSVALYSFFGIIIFDFAQVVPFGLHEKVELSSVVTAIKAYFVATLAYILGWTLGNLKTRKIERESAPIYFSLQFRRMTVVLSMVSIWLFIFGNGGLTPLIERTGYKDVSYDRIQFLLVSYTVLLPFSVFCLAFVRNSYLRRALLILHVLLPFAASVRLSGMVLFLYGLGVFTRSGFRISLKFSAFMVCSLYLFVWILSIRHNSLQGLLPNLSALFLAPLDSEIALAGLNYLSSYSVYAFSFGLEYLEVSLSTMIATFNPAPTFLRGAHEVFEVPMLNKFSPLPAIATLYLSSVYFLFIFYFFLGMLLNFLTYRISLDRLYAPVVVALFTMAVVYSTQYSLRGFYRLLSLIFFILLLAKVRFFKRHHSHTSVF